MRIEHIGIPKSIPESPQRPELAQGDILVAEVLDIKGDHVFLKNQDSGAVLTAKLLGDIAVSVGDYVETVVDEAGGGRYVLRVIDVSRQMPFGSDSDLSPNTLTAQNQSVRAQALLSTLAMLKNNPGADPKAAAFLSRHGIAGSAENMETISQMAKGVSTVTLMLSEVIKSFGAGKESATSLVQTTQPESNPALTQSSVSVNAQTPNTVTPPGQQIQNPVISDNAAQGNMVAQADMAQIDTQAVKIPAEAQVVLNQIVQEGTQNTTQAPLSSAEPAVPGADTPQTQAAQVMPEAVSQLQSIAGQAIPENQINPQAAAQSMQTATATVSTSENPAALPQQPASDTAAATDAPSLEAKADAVIAAAQTDVKAAAAKNVKMPAFVETKAVVEPMERLDLSGAPKDLPRNEQIIDRALAIFGNLDDADELAVHLKKAVRELPEQLKELKVLIEHTDNTVKDSVAAKLDQIEKQMSMMSEVKRFDCYQIPLQTAFQQQTTAELYVYKYRGGKKTVDPENILILLGLDTQYMGRVETLIKTNGKSLGIEFNLEDMRLGDEMKADAAHLEQMVKEAGYHLTGISIKQLAARTTVLNAENRLEKEADSSAGNVDVRI